MKFIPQILNLDAQQEICYVMESNTTYKFGEILQLAAGLKAMVEIYTVQPPKKIMILTSNTLHWLIADQYCLQQGVTQVCIPLSFTSEQAGNLLNEVDAVLTDKNGFEKLQFWNQEGLNLSRLEIIQFDIMQLKQLVPSSFKKRQTPDVFKIIHTSGSTGNPKGVIITEQGINEVLNSLHECLPQQISQRYLSLVPCSLLLEQVTIYLTLLRGGKIIISGKPQKLLGEGNALASHFLSLIQKAQPTSMAVPPSIAKAFYDHGKGLHNSQNLVQSLFHQKSSPFISCGGAPISPAILKYLQSQNIAIYEGYGLSENTSVVAVNTPEKNKIGTVGLPLKHVQIKLSKIGELLVKSPSLFKGYVNYSNSNSFTEDHWLKTGDIASIDQEGYITITGRIKDTLINQHGRNFDRKWLENQYKNLAEIDDISITDHQKEFFSAEIIKNKNYSITDSIKSIRKLEKEVLVNVSIGSYTFENKILTLK